MGSREPRTEAGRALLRQIAIDHPTWPEQGLTDDILAIEDEAVKAERERLRAAVEGLHVTPLGHGFPPGTDPYEAFLSGMDRTRDAVLDFLYEAREEAEEPGLVTHRADCSYCDHGLLYRCSCYRQKARA